MMNSFSAVLEAHAPALGRFRSYRLAAGTNLFGTWLVEITCGRIGTRGRCLRYVVGGKEEARKLVRKTLRRRATAQEAHRGQLPLSGTGRSVGVGAGDG